VAKKIKMENINLNINSKIAQRPKMAKKEVKKASRAFFFSILTFLFLAILIFSGYKFLNYFLKHPDFRVKRVQIQNNRTISARRITNIARIGTNENIYAASLNSYVKRLEKHPDIKTAVVKKAHPDKIIIKIIEREPVAVIMLSGSLNDLPIDNEGFILSENKMKYALELPKIFGVKPAIYKPGTIIDDERVLTALRFGDTLKNVYQNTFINIKNIYLDIPQQIVFKTASVEKIIIGSKWKLEQVMRLVAVVDNLRFQRINAQKIDLRFNDVAVTPKPM